jgi:hypothetical protein
VSRRADDDPDDWPDPFPPSTHIWSVEGPAVNVVSMCEVSDVQLTSKQTDQQLERAKVLRWVDKKGRRRFGFG